MPILLIATFVSEKAANHGWMIFVEISRWRFSLTRCLNLNAMKHNSRQLCPWTITFSYLPNLKWIIIITWQIRSALEMKPATFKSVANTARRRLWHLISVSVMEDGSASDAFSVISDVELWFWLFVPITMQHLRTYLAHDNLGAQDYKDLLVPLKRFNIFTELS